MYLIVVLMCWMLLLLFYFVGWDWRFDACVCFVVLIWLWGFTFGSLVCWVLSDGFVILLDLLVVSVWIEIAEFVGIIIC